MTEITIRKATMDDYETLLRFEQGVIAAERSFDPTLDEDPIHYYDIKQLIDAPHIHLVVAAAGNNVVGCGYARIQDAKPYLRHAKYSYLGFMYTDPKFRGQGVNQKIVKVLKDWSMSRGISEMRLEVYASNAAAIKAYMKSGFYNHMVEMRMALGSD